MILFTNIKTFFFFNFFPYQIQLNLMRLVEGFCCGDTLDDDDDGWWFDVMKRWRQRRTMTIADDDDDDEKITHKKKTRRANEERAGCFGAATQKNAMDFFFYNHGARLSLIFLQIYANFFFYKIRKHAGPTTLDSHTRERDSERTEFVRARRRKMWYHKKKIIHNLRLYSKCFFCLVSRLQKWFCVRGKFFSNVLRRVCLRC